jgi:hypothetical protein
MIEMILQRNSELVLSEPRYSGGLLYLYPTLTFGKGTNGMNNKFMGK